jgi:hypothetical protein
MTDEKPQPSAGPLTDLQRARIDYARRDLEYARAEDLAQLPADGLILIIERLRTPMPLAPEYLHLVFPNTQFEALLYGRASRDPKSRDTASKTNSEPAAPSAATAAGPSPTNSKTSASPHPATQPAHATTSKNSSTPSKTAPPSPASPASSSPSKPAATTATSKPTYDSATPAPTPTPCSATTAPSTTCPNARTARPPPWTPSPPKTKPKASGTGTSAPLPPHHQEVDRPRPPRRGACETPPLLHPALRRVR